MRLTKHHGLGNDFLVLLDLAGDQPVDPADAVALCDRRSGIGADGLLLATAGTDGAELTMVLLNADGSRAEMSGNGIRCLVQAALQAGAVAGPVVTVRTDAGLRTVTVVDSSSPRDHRMSVEMGGAKVLGPEPQWVGDGVARAVRVDVGNPHLVLEWTGGALPTGADLVAIGARIDGAVPGGANVELITAGRDGIDMVVYERGVGPTLACGTGACAVAAAAHEWGLAGDRAEVRMPGGAVDIELGDPVLLTGDTTSVASLDAPWPTA
jgi:diaminopimelate epimerase